MSKKLNRAQRRQRAAKQATIKRHAHYFSRQAGWSRVLNILKHHNNAPMKKEDYNKIMMKPYLAYGQLRLGKAEGDDIAVLVQSFSFTQGMLQRFHDFSNLKDEMQSMMSDVVNAEEALNALAKRSQSSGSEQFIATGEELKAIQRCLGVLDGLVEVSTINHVSAALQYSIDKMNHRRARFERAEQERTGLAAN